MIDLNPLDILNKRKITTIPVHFEKVTVPDNAFIEISDWIDVNLKGRFAVNFYPVVKDNTFKTSTVVAFEDKSELTYFLLACPFIRSKK